MEFNFALLISVALAGMFIEKLVGWDLWKLVGSLGLAFTLIRQLPLLLAQGTTNAMVERFFSDIPSIIVGGVAAVFARRICRFTNSLFKGRWV